MSEFYVTVEVSTYILVTLYRRGVLSLQKSSGIDDIGGIKWQIAGCGILTFTILYLSLWKSVKSAGKVFVTKQQMILILISKFRIEVLLSKGQTKTWKEYHVLIGCYQNKH